MTLERVNIFHHLTVDGPGEVTASTLAALAKLVPERAKVLVEYTKPSAAMITAWSWLATWSDEDNEQPERPDPSGKVTAESENLPSAVELLAAYDDAAIHLVGTLDGTNDPRCLVVSNATVERFGYAVGVQCELQLGHSPLRNGAGHKFAWKADQ